MKRPIEFLLSFSSFSIHNSSFSFTYPWPPEAKVEEHMAGKRFFIIILAIVILFVGSTTADSVKEIAAKVAGNSGPVFDRAQRLVTWMNDNFEWTATDYKNRSIEEIIQRRAGNCADQAIVLSALFKAAGIKARWVAEINIHPKSQRRQKSAEKLVARKGFKLSVFGYMHNDHRWLEVYDDSSKTWFPADPSLGIVGVKAWIAARLSFKKRPEAAKDMIVPFAVIAKEIGGYKPEEDRTVHYLITKFNLYYDNKLETSSAWPQWVSLVKKLSRLGISAFSGELNLHKHTDLMEQLLHVYNQLKNEFLANEINKE
jgi:hypothetical protein